MTFDPNNPLYKCECGFIGMKVDFEYRPHCKAIVFPEIKLKMLFVDDRRKRIHHALTSYPEFEVAIAPNVPEALRAMASEDWDVISFDHDLMGHDFEDTDSPNCGMEIVRYIEKTGWPPQKKKPEFWIHSSNLFAAHLMVVKLTELGYEAWYKPITYKVEHMQYDEKGIPK